MLQLKFLFYICTVNNTRFATAIHIMTLLAKHPDEYLSSDYIAGSINVNAVIVRKEISVLKDAGLVESRKGKEGGCVLNRKSKDIKVADIYYAVKNTEILGKKNENTNPKCPVGKTINRKLENLITEADEVLSKFLSKKSLAEFAG